MCLADEMEQSGQSASLSSPCNPLCRCLSQCPHQQLPNAVLLHAAWYIVGASVSSGVSTAPFQRWCSDLPGTSQHKMHSLGVTMHAQGGHQIAMC